MLDKRVLVMKITLFENMSSDQTTNKKKLKVKNSLFNSFKND